MTSPSNQEEFNDGSKTGPPAQPGPPVVAICIVTILLIVAAIFVVTSLKQPELNWYPLSTQNPREIGDSLVGPTVYTIDSRRNGLAFFDFSSASAVETPDSLGWDLAFHRFTVLANGGPGFSGKGGIRDLGSVSLDSITSVPVDGYFVNTETPEPTNLAMFKWYNYSWTSHILQPKPKVFSVRTADGRYGIFQILSYYCPAAQPGCITFRYRYQGSGSTMFKQEKGPDVL